MIPGNNLERAELSLRYKIIIPVTLAIFAFIAAIDAYLGVGAVQMLVEICFPEGAEAPMAQPLPMKHDDKTLPFLAAGFAFASASIFMHYQTDTADEEAREFAIFGRDFKILAALSILANTQDRYGPDDIMRTFKKATGQRLSKQDATAAFDLFDREDYADDLALFAEVNNGADRAHILRAALQFPQDLDDDAKSLAVIEEITRAMNMRIPKRVGGKTPRSTIPSIVPLGEPRALKQAGVGTKAPRRQKSLQSTVSSA